MPVLVSNPLINPQLCKVFNQAKHNWAEPWIIEPKFDGLRCWIVVAPNKGVKWVTAYSRNGKSLWNMEPILTEAARNAPAEGCVLDGEVYTKDWNLSMSIVKRSTQTHPDQDKLRYHIWDCLTLDELNATWTDARKEEHQCYSAVSNHVRKQRLSLWAEGKYIELVPTKFVESYEQLQQIYTDFLTEGYEGAILKQPDAAYYGGRRSPYWLKVKPWTDADLTIVGAYAGEGKHQGRVGGLNLEGTAEWNGREYAVHTECGTGFTDEEREFYQKLWDNGQLVGRIVEIKFQDITADGACRFPVYNRLREDKE